MKEYTYKNKEWEDRDIMFNNNEWQDIIDWAIETLKKQWATEITPKL